MVTDPTKSIRKHDHPSAFDLSAAELLERLSSLPAQREVPYLTITLDWTIQGDNPARRQAEEVKRSQMKHQNDDGGSERPALRELEKEFDRLIDEVGPRGELFDKLTESKERVLAWLREDLDPAAQGVYIVTHQPSDVFEATGLGLPIETNVTLSDMPSLYKLVRVIEDHPTYAVLQADQGEAHLSYITHGAKDRSVVLDSTLYPRKQMQGGWSQKRFQKRADERVEAFARDTLEAVEKSIRDTGVETLILAGNEVMMSALQNEMPNSLQEIVTDPIRMESVVTPSEKIEQTVEIAEEAERQREDRSVERVEAGVGAGTYGVAGVNDVIQALQNGQVEKLVMLDTFDGDGWADYDMYVFGADNLPTEHPYGGEVTNLVAVDLKDELVRLAISTGANVDIIHSPLPVEDDIEVPKDGEERITDAAARLEEMGGVGAVLRYTLDGDAEPATV